MASVVESGEFVAVEPVVAAGDEMNDDSGEGDEEEESEMTGLERAARGE